jgi:arylsulfate sulfotransferase
MKMLKKTLLSLLTLLALVSAPAFATVTIVSLTPSAKSPLPIGGAVIWSATARDSNAGPLTFQFNVAPPNGPLATVIDFNVGKLSGGGVWHALQFNWPLTGTDGVYQVQVVAKDFTSGESSSQTVSYTVTSPLTGADPVVLTTRNPLVALFVAPPCPAGSTMAVSFQPQSASVPATTTNWANCLPSSAMTFQIAGMYPSTSYTMYPQVSTGGNSANGPTVSFSTGALPADVPFPAFSVVTPAADNTYPVILHTFAHFGLKEGAYYPNVATDLAGNVIWYYYPDDQNGAMLTRPLQGGGTITIQNDLAWVPKLKHAQLLRQIDLEGNIVRETNMGAIQQELVALGAVDGGPCAAIPSPAPVGAACTGGFHHDAIQSLPNGYTAALISIEKIFPPGTQGDKSGLPVDIVGDMIIVLDTNWQVVWYWDVFDPAGGGNGYPKLPVSRTAPLGETCSAEQSSCPPLFLLGHGIAPLAHDWLHANALYYWPAPGDGNATGGDIVWSSRHQDSIMKVDYRDGTGTGNMLWRMGPPDDLTPAGDFVFVNTWNDPWVWFSHQHEVGMENGGAGPMTIFDNGNTRLSPPPLGLGKGNCKPYDCDSRGIALTVDESALTVTPVVSFDLGYYSPAMGSAQLLADGNYFFQNPLVIATGQAVVSYSVEIAPTNPAPQVGPANFLLDVASPEHYRGWLMPSLYDPPTT